MSKADIAKDIAEAPQTFVAVEECEIYSLPLDAVARIPIVRWKLFEAFRNSHFYAAQRYRSDKR
jgi:hypothetical protein